MVNEIVILFFGQLAEITGNNAIRVAGLKDTNEATEKVLKEFPLLKTFTYVVAVDHKIISGNTNLTGKQTIAFMPPFSGG